MHDNGRRYALEIESVSKVFPDEKTGRDFVALRDATLNIPVGSFVSLIGPSGCGKSTLLNMCAGVLTPSSGKIKVNGEPLLGPNTQAGYVTQDPNLLPWLSVEQNVALPLRIRGSSKRQSIFIAKEWVEIVGLGGFGDVYPRELSGGMQKRCSIARTLAYDPDTILMDEPFGALDAITRQVLQQDMLDIWEKHGGKTVLFVTHDLQEAITLSDYVVVMGTKPGRIVTQVVDDLPKPRDVYTTTQAPGYGDLAKKMWEIVRANLPERAGRYRTSEDTLEGALDDGH